MLKPENDSLLRVLQELKAYIPLHTQESSTVSEVNVGWHLVHSAKVIQSVVMALEKSDPNTYQWKFNIKSVIFLTLGYIPRGYGKAPRSVRPRLSLTTEGIQKRIDETEQAVVTMNSLSETCHLTHNDLGPLHLKRAKRFMVVHTKHHIKIIEAILKKKQ